MLIHKLDIYTQASGTILEGKKRVYKSQNAGLVHGETVFCNDKIAAVGNS